MNICDNLTINHKGNFEDFLHTLRTYESGISDNKFDWYKKNLHTPVIHYPIVTKPGRV